ncbi:hypothetical protein ASF72_05880 [Arthrobacter sp. Leaf141]|uniref:ABC transporter substrate-binding protein n=1 Tax=Arthrobacter sp. Leaf141 TaxID=1736273 RepID=UPI0006F77435|nr:ABC transporter substrate-binding protein [Arthrobacter sp. Leaf141]KQR03842.1 hypothetical protein ASF72_05880 [Arthrobacter sp. Leaf141]
MSASAPRSPFRSVLPVLSVGLAAALALSSCAGGFESSSDASSSTTGGTGGRIVAALPTDPTSMDPVKTGSLVVLSVFFNTFDQLTKITADGSLEPKLATEWTPSADMTSWDFTLREGVTFTNGEPLTADDVVFSFSSILADPTSENFGYLSSLKSVAKVDDTKVRFEMKAPFSAFPRNTSLISIVPDQAYAAMGPAAFAAAPVGSGPFKFEKIQRGVSYDLVRNDSYWGEPAKLDAISLVPVASDESRVNGVLSGSLDVAQISPAQAESVKGSGGVNVQSELSNGVVFLGVNSTAGVLKEEKVRRAIGLAIDKEAIVKTVLSGLGEPATQMLAPSVEGFADGLSDGGYNPDQAKKLLAEAGYNGESIDFEYALDGRIPLSGEVAQAIQGYLSAAGVNVNLVGADQASHTLKVRNRQLKGIYLNTWAPSTLDGDLPLTDFYEQAGNNNYAQDPKTAGLAVTQRGVDGAARLDVFKELLTYSNDKAYFIPLYVPANNFAVDKSLAWTQRADGLYDFSATGLTK